jgi:HD-like signal output (HDOD) protein
MQVVNAVLEQKIFEIGTARSAAPFGQLNSVDQVRNLPDVPVLSETLLLMELKSRDRAVDLREISQLVLGDLGAMLQIMRLAADEDVSEDSRPTRIEDCISGLGLPACIEVMSRQTVKRRNRPAAIVETWTHAQRVAENCRYLAEENIVTAHPDAAFMVGLFHTIGTLPEVLGWDWTTQFCDEPELMGLRMAEAWSLPHCVVEYFCELQSHSKPGRWRDTLHRAHRQANLRPFEEALDEKPRLPKISSAWLQLVSS